MDVHPAVGKARPTFEEEPIEEPGSSSEAEPICQDCTPPGAVAPGSLSALPVGCAYKLQSQGSVVGCRGRWVGPCCHGSGYCWGAVLAEPLIRVPQE